MKVRLLDTVEDMNEFHVNELDVDITAYPDLHTVERVKKDKAKKPRLVTVRSRLGKGAEVDLPTMQAEKLIGMKFAEAVVE